MTKCIKCGYESDANLGKFYTPICSICFRFAPNNEENFKKYINEKIDSESLDTFRKFSDIGNLQKKAMIEKASQGNLMSRAPFGYKIENRELVPTLNFREVEEIFEEFLTTSISLTQLAKKHNLSVNGLKKILKNFTYIGKIKFNNQIHEGKHKPIISSTLFNHVQNKLERLGIK
ncbi:MAG: recombinase family protein [Nanoarchaeota archaeon]|nr:recombinase family protein [Nanoarchaeota archaeon]